VCCLQVSIFNAEPGQIRGELKQLPSFYGNDSVARARYPMLPHPCASKQRFRLWRYGRGGDPHSLCIHVSIHMVAAMRFLVPSLRNVARLVTLLFAVQVVAAGACLLTPQAHATPVVQHLAHQNDESHAPCADQTGDHDGMSHRAHDHGDACFHCDEPDVSLIATPPPLQAPTLLATLVMVPSEPVFGQQMLRQLRFVRTPTGPPRSASLLYTTSQRLRI